MSRNNFVFLMTVVLIVVTSALFFIFDCPYLYRELSPAIPIIAAWLFICVMVTLLKTAFMDPGIIPRASCEESSFIEKSLEVPIPDPANYRPPPRTQEIYVKGQAMKLKYCFTCKIFRPPRASHCSMCDNCVERFDHHCPWVGNCVGKRNYRYFYLFLVSLSLLCVYIFACVIAHLVFSVVCFFSVWSVVGLAGFHTYLVTSNLTTNEDIKGTWAAKRGEPNVNPYSSGSSFGNCAEVVCGPIYPSLIRRREIVVPDCEAVDTYGATKSEVRTYHSPANNGLSTQPNFAAPGPNTNPHPVPYSPDSYNRRFHTEPETHTHDNHTNVQNDPSNAHESDDVRDTTSGEDCKRSLLTEQTDTLKKDCERGLLKLSSV
eukprot:gene124-735_t